jgi:hypothetical protein
VPVSQHDVDEFRREAQALPIDGEHVLHTTAELIGFMVADARAMLLDDTEMLERIELISRAAEIDQQELRATRDILAKLGYGLLTRLARQAKARCEPDHDWWTIPDKEQRHAAFVQQGGEERRRNRVVR